VKQSVSKRQFCRVILNIAFRQLSDFIPRNDSDCSDLGDGMTDSFTSFGMTVVRVSRSKKKARICLAFFVLKF